MGPNEPDAYIEDRQSTPTTHERSRIKLQINISTLM